MRYLILLLALSPMAAMITLYLHTLDIEGFDAMVAWMENAFHFQVVEPKYVAYYLSKMAGISALWILLWAFWITPLYAFARFDLREFKKLLGGFAVVYAALHLILWIIAYDYAVGRLGELFVNHLFLDAGMGALMILALAPWVKSLYRFLYIGIVLVMVHLLLAYKTLHVEHIWAISLFALALALRLIKR